jgi:hypothetical protein
MKKQNGPVANGIWAGVVGASVLALFFLVLDVMGGEALQTPRLVAGVLLDRDPNGISMGALILFSLLHFVAFVVVGVVVAYLLGKLPSVPTLLLGFVLGFLLFDAVFYAGVILSGAHVVAEIGWPKVLVGNVLAGVGLMETLNFLRPHAPAPSWGILAREGAVNEGVLAGLLGAGVVAAWFFVFDMMLGRPLLTPGALGSALFLGVERLAEVQVSAVTVLGYTAVHLGLFAAAGILVSAFVRRIEKAPHLIIGGILLFVSLETLFVGYLAIVAEFLLGSLAWWTIALGNLLATAAMATFFLRRHPELRAALHSDLSEEG